MTDLRYGDKGPRVRELQQGINATRYWHPAKSLVVDGEFGPQTAAAVQRAKYWMGYKLANIGEDDESTHAGEMFMGFVTGKVPLKPEMAERRKRRQQRPRPTPEEQLQARILAIAKKDVGLLEGPSNRIKYNDWWPDRKIGDGDNDGGAYCVRAGSYWAWEAGFRSAVWENTDALLADAKAERRGVRLTSDPYGGVGFVIDWSGRSDPDHYGVFVSDNGDGTFNSLEANATLANGRQGVGYHRRRYSQSWFIEREAA